MNVQPNPVRPQTNTQKQEVRDSEDDHVNEYMEVFELGRAKGSQEDEGKSDRATASSSNQVRPAAEAESTEIDVEEEGRVARMMPDPGQPTMRERKLHNLTHMPFRAWCKNCVQGRGRDIYHGRCKEKSRVPRICMDFMFLTERGITVDKSEATKATECICILVLKDEMHESVWAYPMEPRPS